MPIFHHNYDPASQVYSVTFKQGGPVYQYQDVDPDTAATVQDAQPEDLGKTVQAVLVRSAYKFVKVDPDQVADSEGGTL